MIRSAKFLLAAAMLSTTFATAALADGAVLNNTRPGTPDAAAMASAAPLDRFVWGGIGYYGAHYSGATVCNDGFCVTADGGTDGAFGIQVGAAIALAHIAPGFKLDAWGSLTGAFSSGNYFPINIGAGLTYDALAVKFFGGAAFSIVPTSGDTDLGLDLNLMAIYPIPQVVPGLGLMGQLQFDILDNNLFLWNVVVGGTYSF